MTKVGRGKNGIFPIGHSEKNTNYKKNVTFILGSVLVSTSKISFFLKDMEVNTEDIK